MRGDVDGYVAEFNPTGAFGKTVYNDLVQRLHRTKPMWRLVGNGRITLDTEEAHADVPEAEPGADDELLEMPLVSVSKYQVVNSEAEGHVRRVHRLQHRARRTAWLS